ncbi:MAG: peptidoglycan DD-metalloendopeptidase family protein [Xanthomonadales bacterium]|nr:peptidoglycan DD-metalloendopeptidase family protein [Xanthomonadales bacterium]
MLLLCLLAWVGNPAWAESDVAEPGLSENERTERQRLQTELKRLKEEIEQVEAGLRGIRTAERSTQVELRAIELEIAGSARRLIEIGQQLAQVQSELRTLDIERGGLELSLADQREKLSALLRSAYALGRLEQLKLALNQEKLATIGRALAYHRYINAERINEIDRISADLRRLSEILAAVERRRLRVESLHQSEAEANRQLREQRAQRESVLSRIATEIVDRENALAIRQADQERFANLLARIGDVLGDIPRTLPGQRSLSASRGSVPWPAPGRVVLRYGEAPEGEAVRGGISIAAPPGTPVQAISRGRVAFADWLRGFGLLVIVDHGEGWMSLYGYCETLLVNEGDWVEAGGQLGTVGTSGGQTEPALHFQLRRHGETIDPQRWLARRG